MHLNIHCFMRQYAAYLRRCGTSYATLKELLEFVRKIFFIYQHYCQIMCCIFVCDMLGALPCA